MPENVIFVTATDFFTVYPTRTSQDQTSTSVSVLTYTLHNTISTTTAVPSSSSHADIPPSSPPHPTPTNTPPLPATFNPSNPNREPLNAAFPQLVLAATIIATLLFISFISWAIYLRLRGACPQCKALRSQLQKWEAGDLKVVTKEMVKARDVLNAARDLEKLDSVSEVNIRQSTSSIWKKVLKKIRTMTKTKPDMNHNASPESRAVDGDRFFTVHVPSVVSQRSSTNKSLIPPPPLSLSPPPKVHLHPATPNDISEDMYNPPSPMSSSVYSTTTHNVVSDNPFDILDVRPASYQPYTYYSTYTRSGYDNSAADTELGAAAKVVNSATVRAPRRRSRTYGGLPLPEEFEDVELGEKKEERGMSRLNS